MQERLMTGTWFAATDWVIYSMAIAGCFGDGDLSVAGGYLTSMALLVAQRGPGFARRYDVKLRKVAATCEELTIGDVVPLFYKRRPTLSPKTSWMSTWKAKPRLLR